MPKPKKTTKPYKEMNKALKILLVVLMSPISIIMFIVTIVAIILIYYFYVYTPINKSIEVSRFNKLDTDMKIIYEQLKTASGGVDDWIYEKKCEDMTSGLEPDVYDCSIEIYTDKGVTDISEVIAMQSKYFSIIHDNPLLSFKSASSNMSLPTHFASVMANSNYVNKNTNIVCEYIGGLIDKRDKAVRPGLNSWAEKISDTQNGYVYMSLDCTDRTINELY